MRDIMEYAIRCMEMLDDLNIPYGNIKEVTVNTRAKRRWGQCKGIPGGFAININAVLLDENIPDDGLMNTMLHELLHSVPGCMNHGAKWKAMADKVHKAYGIQIKRCSNAEEKGVPTEISNARYKYFLKCPKCGVIFRYTRMCGAVEHPELYHHTRCGTNLVRVEI